MNVDETWAYRLDLGPVPNPCPCEFFHDGYVCLWHLLYEETEDIEDEKAVT